ncbi:MAG: hypothetical protein CO125_11455 [Hydrogenophilales bacterium CG_4_9_14_3_um_filter_59_35]|nr:MAG: hypothetical protein COW70_02850 [Hydrogenophilales bacterium CG18_big_fil_WC_8_21_14_2_50_58_12]PJB04471.1 MAG: hypothetical protein CO125_11455 [Hydrogenophilales bacterium CG_4_9_14_3_um_filter_59_35]
MTHKNKSQPIRDAFFVELINKLRQKPVADEHPSAIEDMKALATEGHAGAARVLAILHMRGRCVPKSMALGLEWLRRSGELGEVGAQFHLALRYEKGWGVLKDETAAFHWSLKAAEMGHLISQTNTGLRYLLGDGISESNEQAVYWLRLAAERGEVISQYFMGSCHKGGTVLPQSDEEALRWHRLAAEQGLADAQVEMAEFYAEGKVVPQSDEGAERWLLLAAEQGNSDAQEKLIECYALGCGVEKSDEKVFYWLTKKAEGGRPESQFLLGISYLIGKVPDFARMEAEDEGSHGESIMDAFGNFIGTFSADLFSEDKQAESYFKIFIPMAKINMLKMGFFSLTDEALLEQLEQLTQEWEFLTLKYLIPELDLELPVQSAWQSDEKALLWLTRAAEKGLEPARSLLDLVVNHMEGDLGGTQGGEPLSVMSHRFNREIPPIFQEAGVRVLRRAAESGHRDAQFSLGEKYDKGEWVPQSAQESFKWFLCAAEQGHPLATLNVIRSETFNHEDQEKAFHLLRQADNPGDWQPEIKRALGDLYVSMQSYDLALEAYIAGSIFDSAAGLLIEELALVSHPDNAKALELLNCVSEVGDLIAGLLPNTHGANQRLRNAVESLYPLVNENRKIPLPKNPKLCTWIVSRLAELETPPLPEQQIAPPATASTSSAQISSAESFSRQAKKLGRELARFSIKVNPNHNVTASLLLAFLESGKDRTKAEPHLKLAFENKDAVATYLMHDFYPPASEDRQNLLNSVLDGGIREHIFPNSIIRSVRNSRLALNTDGYSHEFLSRLLDDAQQARNEIHLYREAETQRKLAQAEQEKREAMENMMAMFAHKFRGPVDSILFNTAHQHDERVYVDAARTMNGLLDIFSVVSTCPDKLLGSLKDDTSGEGSPAGVLLHAIKLALVQLLSLRNRRRMSPYYLAYAKKQGDAPQELRLSEWTREKSWQESEKSLQTRWEQEVGGMIVTASLDVVNAWMATHLLPTSTDGFAESETRFAQYGPKASLLTVIFTEVLVNGIKHSTPAAVEPIALSWCEGDEETVFSCVNPSSKESRTREASKGSGRGHKFLGLIADHLQGRFDADVFNDTSRVSMTLPSSAIKGETR